MKSPHVLINAWRRGKERFLRALNASKISSLLELGGKLLDTEVKVVNLKNEWQNDLNEGDDHKNPWSITTLRF